MLATTRDPCGMSRPPGASSRCHAAEPTCPALGHRTERSACLGRRCQSHSLDIETRGRRRGKCGQPRLTTQSRQSVTSSKTEGTVACNVEVPKHLVATVHGDPTSLPVGAQPELEVAAVPAARARHLSLVGQGPGLERSELEAKTVEPPFEGLLDRLLLDVRLGRATLTLETRVGRFAINSAAQ